MLVNLFQMGSWRWYRWPLMLFLLSCFFCIWHPIDAHAQRSINKIKHTADKHFAEQNYRQALNDYIRYNQYKSGVTAIIKRMAICQFQTNQVDRAHENMNTLLSAGVLDDAESFYYLGEILLHLNDYVPAARAYKTYLGLDKKSKRRDEVVLKIKNCESGNTMRSQLSKGVVQNLGVEINSIEDDMYVILDKYNTDKIYYSSNFNRSEANPLNAKKSFDIYTGERRADVWKGSDQPINRHASSRDELPLGEFHNDEIIIVQRGRLAGSEVVTDSIKNLDTVEENPSFQRADMPYFPEYEDQALFNYNDSVMLFSSRRPGGFGGFDLYYTVQVGGAWSPPINLGASVNTSYDETDPFLIATAEGLYFSSNRPSSIGGFDFFYVSYDNRVKQWGIPINLGLPINSSADEHSIELTLDGTRLLFSSNRKTGYGGYDLYEAYLHRPQSSTSYPLKTNQLGFIELPKLEKTPDSTILVVEVQVDTTAIPIGDIPTSENEIVEDYRAFDSLSMSIFKLASNKPNQVISVYPIYYSKNDQVLNPQSMQELDRLADLMRMYGDLQLQLISHSAGYNGPLAIDLYFSARRAEQIINYLSEKNIQRNRIVVTGVGHQFPYARDIINGEIAGYAKKLNRRIDLRILNDELYGIGFDYQNAGISSDFVDSRSDQLVQLMAGLSYKIEVIKSQQPIQDFNLSTWPFPTVEILPGESDYAYTIGWEKTFTAARMIFKAIKKESFSKARIVPYLNGKRLNQGQLEQLRTILPAFDELLTN